MMHIKMNEMAIQALMNIITFDLNGVISAASLRFTWHLTRRKLFLLQESNFFRGKQTFQWTQWNDGNIFEFIKYVKNIFDTIGLYFNPNESLV